MVALRFSGRKVRDPGWLWAVIRSIVHSFGRMCAVSAPLDLCASGALTRSRPVHAVISREAPSKRPEEARVEEAAVEAGIETRVEEAAVEARVEEATVEAGIETRVEEAAVKARIEA